jgi:metal-sulfur cluster biosynthetic enzyme
MIDTADRPAPDDALQPVPFLGDEALRQPITAALRKVVDPEVGMSIVDVGLIYQVTAADGRVHVLMTMTSPACPVADEIMDDVERQLDPVVPPDQKIELELCWEPPWSPECITPQGRRLMGW